MKKKQPVEKPNRSPFHPIMIDMCGMNEEDRQTLKKALRDKELIS